MAFPAGDKAGCMLRRLESPSWHARYYISLYAAGVLVEYNYPKFIAKKVTLIPCIELFIWNLQLH
jgi:hypothetical protein